MNRRGVSYDVGRVMGINWRPNYDPAIVHRELEIIKHDLHCNTVRICGVDLKRLLFAAEDALKQGLDVWLSPELWNRSPEATLAYLVKAASAAEPLRMRYPDRLVFLMNSELTLFMQGIIPGKTFMQRLGSAFAGGIVRAGGHNPRLNAFLTKATAAVREQFHGPLSYASLIWEKVDWNLFDIVGVDHYWDERIKDQYVEMLKPLFAYDKPVVITEFGFGTMRAFSTGATALGNVDNRSRLLHQLPLIGRFIRPRLTKIGERDEQWQAQQLVDQLTLLESAGVDGAFIFCFVFPINPYDETPKYDLDRDSTSLVKSYANGRRGTTYPDMPWEPKESFKAVAAYYAANVAQEKRR
jgi:hypothetical protein